MPDQRREAREPLFNAPWPALLLTLVIVVGFLWQGRVGDQVWGPYALVPAELFAGRWEGLFTSIFLHGNWPHVLFNAAGALAFGAPVSRLFGTNLIGGIVFYLFVLVTGALAGLGYSALHQESLGALVGASGAISGLMGAASRMVDRRGELGPILGRTPVGMAVAWTVINLVIGFGFSFLMPGTEGMEIAWEAHIAGFYAGLILVGVFPHARRPDDSYDAGI